MFGLLGTIAAIIVFWQTMQSGSGIVMSLVAGAIAGVVVNFFMSIVGWVLGIFLALLAGIASLFRRQE